MCTQPVGLSSSSNGSASFASASGSASSSSPAVGKTAETGARALASQGVSHRAKRGRDAQEAEAFAESGSSSDLIEVEADSSSLEMDPASDEEMQRRSCGAGRKIVKADPSPPILRSFVQSNVYDENMWALFRRRAPEATFACVAAAKTIPPCLGREKEEFYEAIGTQLATLLSPEHLTKSSLNGLLNSLGEAHASKIEWSFFEKIMHTALKNIGSFFNLSIAEKLKQDVHASLTPEERQCVLAMGIYTKVLHRIFHPLAHSLGDGNSEELEKAVAERRVCFLSSLYESQTPDSIKEKILKYVLPKGDALVELFDSLFKKSSYNAADDISNKKRSILISTLLKAESIEIANFCDPILEHIRENLNLEAVYPDAVFSYLAIFLKKMGDRVQEYPEKIPAYIPIWEKTLFIISQDSLLEEMFGENEALAEFISRVSPYISPQVLGDFFLCLIKSMDFGSLFNVYRAEAYVRRDHWREPDENYRNFCTRLDLIFGEFILPRLSEDAWGEVFIEAVKRWQTPFVDKILEKAGHKISGKAIGSALAALDSHMRREESGDWRSSLVDYCGDSDDDEFTADLLEKMGKSLFGFLEENPDREVPKASLQTALSAFTEPDRVLEEVIGSVVMRLVKYARSKESEAVLEELSGERRGRVLRMAMNLDDGHVLALFATRESWWKGIPKRFFCEIAGTCEELQEKGWTGSLEEMEESGGGITPECSDSEYASDLETDSESDVEESEESDNSEVENSESEV